MGKDKMLLKKTMKVIQRTKLERFNSGRCTCVVTKRERTLEKFNSCIKLLVLVYHSCTNLS